MGLRIETFTGYQIKRFKYFQIIYSSTLELIGIAEFAIWCLKRCHGQGFRNLLLTQLRMHNRLQCILIAYDEHFQTLIFYHTRIIRCQNNQLLLPKENPSVQFYIHMYVLHTFIFWSPESVPNRYYRSESNSEMVESDFWPGRKLSLISMMSQTRYEITKSTKNQIELEINSTKFNSWFIKKPYGFSI